MAPATIPRWTKPVSAWTPPWDAEALTAVLAKIQGWKPFDGDALLDDVGAVLDDVMPPEKDLEDIAQRLRRHLMQLVDIAAAAEAGQKDAEAHRLIQRAREVRAEDMPGDHLQAVGHLRRMAWTTNELLERLVENQCLKEAS
ncbi:DUF6415 family natural product biosynthesis protein [Streptomyces sp. NPDC058272]|uniref:DUF6415 family natural product biosynthesis protein n=1 Tax=Streptomyces sp. NPDC058272 TaxID=3346415 RepID=UPI0036E9E292